MIMRIEELIILVALAVAVLMPKGGMKKAAPLPNNGNGPQAIPIAAPNGWQYFTDGTAISPDGTYYKDGAAVWWPTM